MNNIEEKIMSFAEDNDILAGICDGTAMEYLRPVLMEEYVPFVGYSPDERIDPRVTMLGVKSIVVIGKAYKNDAHLPISALDYHITVKNILKSLADYLSGFIVFNYKIFADTGPMCERALALKAGLGFIGRNRSVISGKYGSFFNIGYMMTDLALTSTALYQKSPDLCAECGRCEQACPGGALRRDKFDYTSCVSFLTQTKDLLTDTQMHIIGENIYGCLDCQNICPYNRTQNIPEPVSDDELLFILSASKKQIADKYKNTAAGWRGGRVLKRNALIALGNRYAGKEFKYINMIEQYMDSEDELLGHTARWAFRNINLRGK